LWGFRRNKELGPALGFDSIPAIWIGGCLFVIAVLLAGYLTPDYSHAHQSISELGTPRAPYGWLVRWAGFVPLGLSFVLFSCQSGGLFSNHIPSVLFILTGLAVLFAGIFPTDPDNRRDTGSGKIHASAVIALLLLLGVAPFTFSISALYRNPPAGWFLVFSFLMGMLVLIFLVLSSNGVYRRLVSLFQRISGRFEKCSFLMPGLHQRLLLSLHYIWWFVFSQVLADVYQLLSS